MADWNHNFLILQHPDQDRLVRVEEEYRKVRLLNHFVPMPIELLTTNDGFDSTDDFHVKTMQLNGEINRSLFGAQDWYDFAMKFWGVKWEIIPDDGSSVLRPGRLALTFSSANGVPFEAYCAMERQGFAVKAYAYDPSWLYMYRYINGDISEQPMPSSYQLAPQFFSAEALAALQIEEFYKEMTSG